ncbi:MAG TPA: glycoside hydrolase family 66 protein, partial [Thermomicrobiales bacterium]|nr:glycoside hydrolase family 66 protein [Thermomicrobiales bacterium]
DDFTDALGRSLSLASVRTAIACVQATNAAAFAYGAVYGAEPEYADAHPDLVLSDEDGRRISLAELFYIMNIAPDSPWTAMIVEEFAAAVRALDFDGIHLDQYGFPKTALTAGGERVDLAEHFPPLIDAARAAVVAVKPDAGVIFNAVENWPIETVAGTTQDAVYIEVWPPYEAYQDLRELIRDGKRLGGDKQVILAAYLTPFLDAPHAPESEAAALLATAVIAASGGFHLLLGERDGILCDPYYPKYATARPEFVPTLRAYSDFLVRYEEWFVAPDIVDWDDDGSLPFTAENVTTDPRAGSVWAITRRKPGVRIVHLINLTDQANIAWNAPHTPPQPCHGIALTFRNLPPVDRALVISPDIDHGRALPVQMVHQDKTIRLTVPRLDVWTTVLLVQNDAAS